ncbi:hemin uptake protein HemP [Dokdonella sp.]|uniref:hemin uptake protein HemP n=1 Tax=Dokdonella sp. TaxID=2291710 RepID=UPI0025B9386A|nr:hemin uptake protein HemP [Dokdonella sp.]MBX3687964.1 hemin uptake protein HemP [Dokdonella sp.]
MFEPQPFAGAGSVAAQSPVFDSARPLPTKLRIDSARLLGGARELVIEHAGQEYHLRLTRNDKLILTK